jgi:hypothetical protein
MATSTLNLPTIAARLHTQFDRMMMLQELTRMTIEALPNNTDSDVAMALLNGMQEILQADTHKMHVLSEGVSDLIAPDTGTLNAPEQEALHG